MYFNNDTKTIGLSAAGAVIGAVQTSLLRQFADIPMATAFMKNTSGTPPILMKQLKGFGSLSALAGIAGGIVGLAVGLAVVLKGAITRSMEVGAVLVGYGSTALFTGLLSGLYPTTAWTAAISVDPNNPVGAINVRRYSAPVASGISRASVPTLEA